MPNSIDGIARGVNDALRLLNLELHEAQVLGQEHGRVVLTRAGRVQRLEERAGNSS